MSLIDPGIVKEAAQSLRVFRRSNAVASAVLASIVVTLPCIYIASQRSTTDAVTYIILGIGSLPVVLFVIAYVYFMFKDPDRLHDVPKPS